MKKNILLSELQSMRYIMKGGLAAALSLGLFATTVNAQNKKDGREANKRIAVTRSTSVTRQSRPNQAHPTKPVVHQRTTNTRQVATVNHNKTVVRRSTNTYKRPVYNAHNPSWRYENTPRRNTVITTVPAGYRTINYGGSAYRYYRGVYYRPYNNTFMVIAPPVGLFINIMPYGYRKIMVNNYPYYYYNGTYYQYRNSNYYVVSPPLGAIVESLPAGYETLTIDGETYYTIDGAQYKPIVQDNGEIWYQVIKAN